MSFSDKFFAPFSDHLIANCKNERICSVVTRSKSQVSNPALSTMKKSPKCLYLCNIRLASLCSGLKIFTLLSFRALTCASFAVLAILKHVFSLTADFILKKMPGATANKRSTARKPAGKKPADKGKRKCCNSGRCCPTARKPAPKKVFQ